MTKIWLDECKESPEVEARLNDYLSTLEQTLHLYTTHYILHENSLLNAKTTELSENCVELLQHILAVETNWDEPEDIGRFSLMYSNIIIDFRSQNANLPTDC